MKVSCMDYEEGDSFPYIELNDNENVHYWVCDETKYEAFQPDYWEDEEFNLVIIFRDRPVRVRSIHFKFCK